MMVSDVSLCVSPSVCPSIWLHLLLWTCSNLSSPMHSSSGHTVFCCLCTPPLDTLFFAVYALLLWTHCFLLYTAYVEENKLCYVMLCYDSLLVCLCYITCSNCSSVPQLYRVENTCLLWTCCNRKFSITLLSMHTDDVSNVKFSHMKIWQNKGMSKKGQ